MSCHASVLAEGHSPHAPHAHVEEELLIPLSGDVELVVPSGSSDPTPRVERTAPGSFVFYPSKQHHTIRNPGTASAAYLMFKWDAPTTGDDTAALGTELVDFAGSAPPDDARAFWSQRLLEGPTRSLTKLHSHLTVLAPGAGYEPHSDAHDVAIVTIEGMVETLGEHVPPQSVVYYGAGALHGLRNVGSRPARYLVFEFHATRAEQLGPPSLRRRLLSRLRRARARRP
jgi:mannose-6-phosphate isomerase-like protein (cupin superfamily)